MRRHVVFWHLPGDRLAELIVQCRSGQRNSVALPSNRESRNGVPRANDFLEADIRIAFSGRRITGSGTAVVADQGPCVAMIKPTAVQRGKAAIRFSTAPMTATGRVPLALNRES